MPYISFPIPSPLLPRCTHSPTRGYWDWRPPAGGFDGRDLAIIHLFPLSLIHFESDFLLISHYAAYIFFSFGFGIFSPVLPSCPESISTALLFIYFFGHSYSFSLPWEYGNLHFQLLVSPSLPSGFSIPIWVIHIHLIFIGCYRPRNKKLNSQLLPIRKKHHNSPYITWLVANVLPRQIFLRQCHHSTDQPKEGSS
jgi:hypothetical protein